MPSLIPFVSPSRHDSEWLGARYELPTTVREGDLILQPSIDLWLELPSMKIVGIRSIDPRTPASFGEGLQETMASPADGPPRRPARIRVPDAALAESLRSSIGNEIEIQVAAVPELDEVLAGLAKHLQTVGDEPAYLDDLIDPAVVGGLFSAAARLFVLAPWRHVTEDQILRVDLPSFGIDGAALCVIGNNDEDSGLLLFRNIRDYKEFSILAGAADWRPSPRGAVTQWSMLSLSFNRKKDTPPRMLEEIAQHRWKVAGAKAYPHVMATGPDATPCPFTELDYQIMTACAEAFITFFPRHRGMFAEESPEVIRESFPTRGNGTITLTAHAG